MKKAFVLPALGTIPFGLIFLGFSIFWLLGASSAGAPDFFILFGLPFVLVGFGIAFGPVVWQTMRYRNTEYMITNRRIITQTGAVGVDTMFVDFDKIQEVYVKIGIVDKMFGTGNLYAVTAGFSGFGPAANHGYGFVGIRGFRPSLAALKEPYQVQRVLQEAIESLRQSRIL